MVVFSRRTSKAVVAVVIPQPLSSKGIFVTFMRPFPPAVFFRRVGRPNWSTTKSPSRAVCSWPCVAALWVLLDLVVGLRLVGPAWINSKWVVTAPKKLHNPAELPLQRDSYLNFMDIVIASH